MMSSPGVEPEPHWWEVSAFTTASTLLPEQISVDIDYSYVVYSW